MNEGLLIFGAFLITIGIIIYGVSVFIVICSGDVFVNSIFSPFITIGLITAITGGIITIISIIKNPKEVSNGHTN